MRHLGAVLFIVFCFFSAPAQSSNQSYPTAISSGEISGKIAARDLGDARLTSYYFAFGGTQGDIFLNVKTVNLDGDIDVFTADNLRPLTKITVFSDNAANETGRVVYLRKPEKLILRIQGRSPDDQPATFNVKFAGSFVPAQAVAGDELPDLPEIKPVNESGARVNSVGTIIEAKPILKPAASETETRTNDRASETPQTENTENMEATAKRAVKPPRRPSRRNTSRNTKPTVVPADESVENSAETARAENKTPAVAPKTKKPRPAKISKEKKNSEPNPLENVRLLIQFKDGTVIERPMSEVLRVGVDKGVLTLITKSGTTTRYSILDVAKMTIE